MASFTMRQMVDFTIVVLIIIVIMYPTLAYAVTALSLAFAFVMYNRLEDMQDVGAIKHLDDNIGCNFRITKV